MGKKGKHGLWKWDRDRRYAFRFTFFPSVYQLHLLRMGRKKKNEAKISRNARRRQKSKPILEW